MNRLERKKLSKFGQYWKEIDKILLFLIIFLQIFGIFMAYSVKDVWNIDNDFLNTDPFLGYLVVSAFSFVLMIYISSFDVVKIKKMSVIGILTILFSLALCWIFNLRVENKLGYNFFGVCVLPVDLLLPFLFLFLASITESFSEKRKTFLIFSSVFCYIFCTCFVIQNEIIYASVLTLAFSLLLFILGYSFYLSIVPAMFFASVLAINFYYVDSFSDYLISVFSYNSNNFDIFKSLEIIDKSSFLGVGFNQGNIKYILDNSFIFSVISEEFGFLGLGVLIFSFMLIIYRLLQFSYENRYSIYTSLSVFFANLFILSLTLINIFYILDLISLSNFVFQVPFFSLQGSFILVISIISGTILSMTRYDKNVDINLLKKSEIDINN